MIDVIHIPEDSEGMESVMTHFAFYAEMYKGAATPGCAFAYSNCLEGARLEIEKGSKGRDTQYPASGWIVEGTIISKGVRALEEKETPDDKRPTRMPEISNEDARFWLMVDFHNDLNQGVMFFFKSDNKSKIIHMLEGLPAMTFGKTSCNKIRWTLLEGRQIWFRHYPASGNLLRYLDRQGRAEKRKKNKRKRKGQ